jgi:signal transduction histidine kinase
MSFFAAGIAMLVKRIREVQPDEASRLRYILIAAFIACLLGITELLPTLKVPAPRLGHFGSVLYSSILAIGLFKHRTAYDILAEMRVKLDMLNELSSGIAHELRNPLSSILGAASLLRNKSEELRDEKSREYLDLISEEVGRLEGILKNYSALIRPMRIEREPIPINQVIQKTVALMQLNAEVPRMQLELAREIPLCRCDPQTMQQVFINLIKNAYEACGASGLIHIETEFIRQFVRITFRDSGKGIPPAILPRVFEPFVSTKTNGMGLGLAICRRLVDLNGGTIEATNENIGACFIIHLPAAETVLPAA